MVCANPGTLQRNTTSDSSHHFAAAKNEFGQAVVEKSVGLPAGLRSASSSRMSAAESAQSKACDAGGRPWMGRLKEGG